MGVGVGSQPTLSPDSLRPPHVHMVASVTTTGCVGGSELGPHSRASRL